MAEAPPATSVVPPQIVKPTPATSTAVTVVNAPPASIAVNAPLASTSAVAAIVHPASTVSATLNSHPVSPVSVPVKAPPASTAIAADAPPGSTALVDADASVSDEVRQPPREEWFRCTCAEVAVDKGAAESMRSTPHQLGLTFQMAVITKSSNLWDNGIVSFDLFVFTSTNNSFSRRPSLTVSSPEHPISELRSPMSLRNGQSTQMLSLLNWIPPSRPIFVLPSIQVPALGRMLQRKLTELHSHFRQ